MVCRSTSSYSSGRKLLRKSWQTAPVRRGGCKQYPKNLSPAVPAWKPMVDTLRIFCNCREAVGRQPHITKPCSYNNFFFLVLLCRFIFCRFGRTFVVRPQRMWNIFELQSSSIFMFGPEESIGILMAHVSAALMSIFTVNL